MSSSLRGPFDKSTHGIEMSHYEKKGEVVVEHKEDVHACFDDEHGDLLDPDVRPAAERRLLRMLDIRLLPAVVLIYMVNYIDRLAVTAARLKGMSQDLSLSDVQYDSIIAILYASYVSAQVPSNVILNRISRPSFYLPSCVIVWGVTSALTGITRGYAGIVAARFCLGIPEAAFYPGVAYLLSRWYTKRELAFRMAIYSTGGLLSNAFSGIMAAGILSGMEGVLGVRAWRWLFYITGAITVFVGIAAIILLPDYPHNTRWLSPAQRHLAQVRLAEDAGSEADEDTTSDSAWCGVRMALKDKKVYIFALIACLDILGTSYANFFPTIVGTLGFSTTDTLLLTAPPWIISTVVCCIICWHADRVGERFVHFCIPLIISIVGYTISVCTSAVPGRYVSICLMACGSAAYAVLLTWVSSSIPRPPAKRSAAIALINGFGNTGAIAASYVWKSEWAPGYHPSMFVGIATLGTSAVLAFVIRCMLVKENKRLEREERDNFTGAQRVRIEEAARLEGISVEEAMKQKRGFRYML